MSRHSCNWWCRPPLHAGLTLSRKPDDISDRIGTDYEANGYRVLHVTRATEMPSDDCRAIVRPFPWLVFRAEERSEPSRRRSRGLQ